MQFVSTPGSWKFAITIGLTVTAMAFYIEAQAHAVVMSSSSIVPQILHPWERSGQTALILTCSLIALGLSVQIIQQHSTRGRALMVGLAVIPAVLISHFVFAYFQFLKWAYFGS